MIIRRGSNRIWAVAACLGLLGIAIGAAIVHYQRANNELVTDALQKGQLRDGWKTLGAAAALDAQGPSATAAPPAPATTVVIVNVPGQPGAPGAQGTPGTQGAPGMPGQPGQSGVVAIPGSMPGTGYVTGQVAPTVQSQPTVAVPGNVVVQPIGNGTLTGSTPSPALSNNGSNVNAGPSPSLPNGSVNASNPTSNLPTGTPNLPTGTPNLPTGTPNLPSGVP